MRFCKLRAQAWKSKAIRSTSTFLQIKRGAQFLPSGWFHYEEALHIFDTQNYAKQNSTAVPVVPVQLQIYCSLVALQVMSIQRLGTPLQHLDSEMDRAALHCISESRCYSGVRLDILGTWQIYSHIYMYLAYHSSCVLEVALAQPVTGTFYLDLRLHIQL